ncbi:hypothetical protein [Neptuniibacter sp.]|jgi:hypothetical protein|uniref:hypothetical protein n=1 Tax=Neptuniibacter sp. TaxID=1962643 RepID=UPI003B5A5F06
MNTQLKALAFSLVLVPGLAVSADEDNVKLLYGISTQAETNMAVEMESKEGMEQINTEIMQRPTAAGKVYKNALFPSDGFEQLGDL